MSVAGMSANLSQATRRVRLFGNIISWMVTDLRRSAKGLYSLIVAFSVLGVFARLGAIGSFMIYIHAQQTGLPIVLGGVQLPSDTGLWTLVLWGSAALVLALAAGVSTYLADVTTFRMARKAMRRVVDRAMAVVAAGQARPLALGNQLGLTKAARKALTGDAMMFMRAMLVFGGVAVPLVTFGVAIVVLFWLDSQLTLILLPVLVIYAIPFYGLNRAIATASRSYEERRQNRAGILTQLLKFASQTQFPGIARPAWSDLSRTEPKGRSSVDAFRGIILLRKRVLLLQDAFFGVVLFVLLIAFGRFIATDEVAWEPLVWYLIALRFAVQGMGQTASAAIRITRFSPQIQRLKQFTAVNTQEPAEHAKDGQAWTFSSSEPVLPGSQRSAAPVAGDVVACIDPGPIDSFCLVELCSRLLGTTNSKKCRRLIDDMFYCGDVRDFPELSIRQPLTGQMNPDPKSVNEAKRVLEHLGVLKEIEALDAAPRTTLSSDSIKALSPLCRYAICLAPGLASQRRYFVLDWKPLSRMDVQTQQAIVELLSDRIVVFVTSAQIPDELLSHVSLVIVLDGSAIRGIGDAQWYRSLTDRSRGHLQLVGAGGTLDQSDDEEIDDDEMDEI